MQESWLSEHSDLSQFDIDDYTLISQGKLCCGHADLIIYLRNNLDDTKIDLVKNTKVWESLFIEVSCFLKKKIIIGNIYRPPLVHKKDHDTFLEELTPILINLQICKHEVVIAGDFNINFLNIGDKINVSDFFDTLTSNSFFPQITFPTKFSKRCGTLIDQLLCKISSNRS